ncbi:MAG: DUF3791 domain-containing protein [Clostridia bacterium]|nr:DUF3791 domain-containing protein [Clostridia bacterium]MBR3954140.1 DUF3791 domain-containing protein [Clostridia bacterium]
MTKSELEFAIFCVENTAAVLQKDAVDVYRAWTAKSRFLYDFIIPEYETLHSQDKNYIIDILLRAMQEWGVAV